MARVQGVIVSLVLLLIVSFALPTAPVQAQGADIDDWRQGDPFVSDSFARNSGQWTTDTGADALRVISRGRLTVEVPEEELFRWATLDTDDLYRDFYIEVDAARLDGPEGGVMGLIFRYADVDNFYAYLTSADGYYTLIAYVDGEFESLIEWTESDALDSSDGAENRLGVLAVGDELALYANDEELERAEDGSFTEGQIALLAGTNAEGGLAVGFDNFGLWTGSGSASVGRRTIRRSSTPEAPARPANTSDAVVATDTLNVRSGPGTNYPAVGSLKRGAAVTITGRSGDSKWAKLALSDVKEAWASAQYLTINIDFAAVQVAAAPPAPTPAPRAQPAQPKNNVAWLVIENHIGRYITAQVNDKNFRVEGKVGDTPGRYQFELQGVGRYKVAAQLPNGGAHNWDLYVEPTADKCVNRQGCVALGQTFLQTYY